MGAKRIPWSAEEDLELRRIYAISIAGQSAKALAQLALRKGTSRENCRNRAEYLGLLRVAGKHRYWTDTEVENLKYYAGPHWNAEDRAHSRALLRIGDLPT